METSAPIRQSRPLKRRRVIERPRLFTLLDESTTRVRTLIAAAGYGKTTLAEQWVARSGRRGVWFTARSASTDVAALALGVARAASELVPDCDERLRAHLRAVPNPGERVHVLAEILGEELAGWASTDWLVLDEYQELVGARDAELFVEELVACCPVQLLIASRLRPTWISSRSILYGDVLELNQTALAMDTHEAAELLEGRSGASASGLVALANGWPAVIALASVTDTESSDAAEVPDSLYSFFAEEVFESLGDHVKEGLAKLAVAPTLDRELAVKLVGAEVAEEVCDAALDIGILKERGVRLELHPLARSFFDERYGALVGESGSGHAATCCSHYMYLRDWDAAFEVIIRRGLTPELENLIGHALDELLDTSQLSTIETWSDAAVRADVARPLASIAKAEVALRRGRHTEAQAFGEMAAAGDEILKCRALSVAGRAAHLGSREETALELYRRAEAAATTEVERREALWGQLVCALALELPESREMLESLRPDVGFVDTREVVRAAACDIAYQLHFGPLHLTGADIARELVASVADPLVRTSFLNLYSHALALCGRYPDAEEVVAALLVEIERHQLDFALPYALITAATVSAGTRQWSRARSQLDHALATAKAARNSHGEQLCYAARVRALVQEGRHRSALSVEVPALYGASQTTRAEVLTSRALVLGIAEHIEEARALIDDVRGTTSAVETLVLIAGVDAVIAVKRRDRASTTRVNEFEQLAFQTGGLDMLMTVYRACPELLAILLRRSSDHDLFYAFVQKVGDGDLCKAVGHPLIVSEDDLRARLTPREREVYELLRQGLSNRQIAEALVITEGTAKLHTHHVFDKVGTRSRTSIAIQAALERADQATSATDGNAVSG